MAYNIIVIRPRTGLVPAATQEFGWEAVVNGDIILATTKNDAETKAQAREAEIRALRDVLKIIC